MAIAAFLIVTFVLFILYAAMQLIYRNWFMKLSAFEMPIQFIANTSFSIIIPARNEANNIADCLQSVLQQNYPANLFEVIVVDDFSTDNTAEIIQQLQQQYSNLQLIKLADIVQDKQLNSYKKKAIETAIGFSKNDWIVTTDADCFVSKRWLQLYAAYIQQNEPVFVAAAVAFTNNGSVLESFQCIDFMALQGITAAAVSAGFHSMCNGANLAYKKTVFYEVGGFKGIDKIASGDDLLLMNKIKEKHANKIGFLYNTNAVVSTKPMDSWQGFFNQRIRWASKAKNYDDKSIFWVLFMVYLFNLSLVIMPFLAIISPSLIIYWLLFLTAKTIVEATFAFKIAAFFKINFKWWYPLLQLPHISYMVIAGWLGAFGKYKWKGRQVK